MRFLPGHDLVSSEHSKGRCLARPVHTKQAKAFLTHIWLTIISTNKELSSHPPTLSLTPKVRPRTASNLPNFLERLHTVIAFRVCKYRYKRRKTNTFLYVISCTWNTVSFSSLTSLSTLLGIDTLDPYTISFILIHSSLVMFSSVKMRIVQKRRTLTARMTRLMLIPDWESQVQKERVSLMIGMS